MNDFIKMDVFFVITTIAVIMFIIVIAVVGYYIIKILRDVKKISQTAKTETENLAQDLEDLRANARQEGLKFKHLGKFIASIYKRHKK